MKYQIQWKCTRWCNAGNYSRYCKESYTNLDEARADLEAYKARNPEKETRLVIAEGRKYTEIM